MKRLLLAAFCISQLLMSCSNKDRAIEGETEITKWQDGKRAAVSITYDDGSMNQFRVAIPIMNSYKLPATFFIITGHIPGSDYKSKFIGRPLQTILSETTTILTNKENFFERASAVGFLDYDGIFDSHKQIGSLYDSGKTEEAYKLTDETYKQVREGKFKPGNKGTTWSAEGKDLTWDDIRKYAAQGHEFGSHTVTHPRLAALDEVNLLYELEKSKADILKQLGPEHTFSAEGPFGTENERVMEYAHKIYPALRNRMPEHYLEEINRSSKMNPGTSGKDYVQWQRGITTKTDMPLIKSWVDTVASHNNNWLVLVIHGVDGLGYEPLPGPFLDEYFKYIKGKDDTVWVATFGDATKYMRERMSAKVSGEEKDDKVLVRLTHALDKGMYALPLTLKTYVSRSWKKVKVKQDGNEQIVNAVKDDKGSYIMYRAAPNSGEVEITKL